MQLEEYKKLKATTLANRKQSARPSASPAPSTGSTAVLSPEAKAVSQAAAPEAQAQPDAASVADAESEPPEPEFDASSRNAASRALQTPPGPTAPQAGDSDQQLFDSLGEQADTTASPLTPSAQQASSRLTTDVDIDSAEIAAATSASTTPQFPAVQPATPPADTAQYAQLGVAEGPPQENALDSPHLFPTNANGTVSQPVSFTGPGEANGDAAPHSLPVEQMPDPHLLQDEQTVWDNDAFSTTSGLPTRQNSQAKELLSPRPGSAAAAALQADLEAARARVRQQELATSELEQEATRLRTEVTPAEALSMPAWLSKPSLESACSASHHDQLLTADSTEACAHDHRNLRIKSWALHCRSMRCRGIETARRRAMSSCKAK